MGIFGRTVSRKTQLSDETNALRESIRNRGQVQIPEATTAVESVVSQVLARARALNNDQARLWVLDRIRLFLVTVIGPKTFEILKSLDISELPELEVEYRALATSPKQYNAPHLVAWIWLLQRSLFEPLLQEQFRQMEGVLVERVSSILASGGNFESQLVDWDEFFRV
jgi:hypothetical protein